MKTAIHFSSTDKKWMNHALALAKNGQGKVQPNPMVGAVIVHNNKLISEGWHARFGSDHAEVAAVKKAAEIPEGSSMYVTLEPCSHEGKTPACSLMLARSSIQRFVIGHQDPNPIVSGKGVDDLQKAGKTVEVGCLEEACKALNPYFLTLMNKNRPFISVKVAVSLDGKIATATGESKWISGPEARNYTHQLRNDHMAIMVGTNTLIADNPLLNTRLEVKELRHPLRIILDTHARSPLSLQVFKSPEFGKTLWVTAEDIPHKKIKPRLHEGVEWLGCPLANGRIDLNFLMEELGKRQIDSLLVEGGGILIESLIRQKLADRLYWFIAPKLLGGQYAPTALEGEGFGKLEEVPHLQYEQVNQIGNDILIQAKFI